MTEPLDVPLPAQGARSWYSHYRWLDAVARWASDLLRTATSAEVGNSLVRRSPSSAVGLNNVFGLAAPTASDHATNKGYVDALGTALATADTIVRRGTGAGFTNLSGLYLVNSPTTASEATRKDYVDALGTSGNTPDTVMRRNSSRLVAVQNVVLESTSPADNHATRKDYVDNRTRPVPRFITASTTIGLTDESNAIFSNQATGDVAVTIPANASVAFPVNGFVDLLRWQTGTLSVALEAGVTLVNGVSLSPAQYQTIRLIKVATDTWFAQRIDTVGTNLNTASTVVRRDAAGWFSAQGIGVVDAPSLAQHLTRKDYVDAIGTAANTFSTVVRRDGNGLSTFSAVSLNNQPSAADRATRKDYVDGRTAAIVSIAAAPTFLGQTAVVAGIGYMATGTATAADWKQVTN